MHFIDASINKNAYKDFERLYIESFPQNERFKLSFLREKTKSGDSKLFSIYENLGQKIQQETQQEIQQTPQETQPKTQNFEQKPSANKHSTQQTPQQKSEREIKLESQFIGLVNLIFHNDIVFIFYLAVDSKVRGSGLGSAILSELRQQYEGRRMCLCIEILGEHFENNAERVRRKNFYLKNGFIECGYSFFERGVEFEMLGTRKVSKAEFEELLVNYFGEKHFGEYYDF